MNRNGHILIFSAYYPPHLGGVELYTLHLSDALRKIGYKTTVVTSGFKDEDPNTDESADVIRIPSVSIANDRFPIILPGRKLKAIYGFLLRSNASHIVINTRYYPLTLMGLALAKQLGIRPLIIDHSSGPISSDASILGALLRLYENISNFLIRRHSPSFVPFQRAEPPGQAASDSTHRMLFTTLSTPMNLEKPPRHAIGDRSLAAQAKLFL